MLILLEEAFSICFLFCYISWSIDQYTCCPKLWLFNIMQICLIKISCKLAIKELKRWMKPEKVISFGILLLVERFFFTMLIDVKHYKMTISLIYRLVQH